MKKNIFTALIFLMAFFSFDLVQADSVAPQVAGKILLQVESEGEGWYVHPVEKKRYYLGRPADAFNIMRQLGQGISNKDLKKIPVAVSRVSGDDTDDDGVPNFLERALGMDTTKKDTDGDGFKDKQELENNYNPRKEGVKFPIDRELVKRNTGKIFLQVESNGEAWYLNPENEKRYFLGRPQDAFNIMRNLGLGIKSEDLEKIPQASLAEFEQTEPSSESETSIVTPTSSPYDLAELETELHELVNEKRRENDLGKVARNKEVREVAREHSRNLVEENQAFTGGSDSCDLPMIHHEGLDFGFYSDDRLRNRGVNYFSQTGENLALVSTEIHTFTYEEDAQNPAEKCQEIRNNLNTQFKSNLNEAESEEEKKKVIKQEIENRKEVFNNMDSIEVTAQEIKGREEVVRDVVQGWMNSPPHRENILEGSYNEAGMGVAYVNGHIIATQVFIKKIDCGYEGGPCCEEEGYYPYCYQPLECQEGTCVSTSTNN